MSVVIGGAAKLPRPSKARSDPSSTQGRRPSARSRLPRPRSPPRPRTRERRPSAMDLSIGAVALLAVAGFLAGAINAAAGGGSLVTFPALVAVGYPPLLANVTNNVAVCPGYVTGAWGYRRELRGQRRRILALVAVSAFGSSVGVGLILVSWQGAFEEVVPFLV